MKKIINLIAEKQDFNIRVDTFISNNINELSRTRVKNLILNGGLKINKIVIYDPSKKISKTDVINLEIPEPKKASLKPYKYDLDIVYEDNDLILINKSAGISMHPGAGNYDKTVVNALMSLKNKNFSNIGDELRPGIVHRIDKDTSGLIVIAKNNKAHEYLANQFSNHTISRVYMALVWGKLRPQNGRIETLITRSSKNRQMMEVGLTKGKKAVTNYKTIEIFENKNVPTFSLIRCKLETGRTHQIRVHMSFKGNNILGDKKYKKKYKNFKNIDPDLEKYILNLDRQFLHAQFIGFDHPTTGERLEFTSELPIDLKKILKKLRNSNK
tara:strand:+ start:63 stop:1043 length:981 start_codon:yes stop_codon:yes gene_type:complete